ncbi:carbamoyltransferase N-terminal domain-containing protein [Streptomyces paludis]|uniref:carbamoyltransferase N-terminal domain-containing protein n=1 Tax=Streptomyces paludis TaxID=2282738 RepID=UPI001E479BAC|nr:carbamoyltransferase N-terminal domain-containing protein [Streptomyces paludis]
MDHAPSVILGLCSFTHDSAAALLVDGELLGFVEEERLSGKKHTREYPHRAIDWLLDDAGLTPGDIDAVAYNFQPARYLAETPAALRGGWSLLDDVSPGPASRPYCTTALTS